MVEYMKNNLKNLLLALVALGALTNGVVVAAPKTEVAKTEKAENAEEKGSVFGDNPYICVGGLVVTAVAGGIAIWANGKEALIPTKGGVETAQNKLVRFGKRVAPWIAAAGAATAVTAKLGGFKRLAGSSSTELTVETEDAKKAKVDAANAELLAATKELTDTEALVADVKLDAAALVKLVADAEAVLTAAKAKTPVVAVAEVTAEALAEEVKVAEAALAAAKAKTPVVAVAEVTAEALAEEVKAAEAALAAANKLESDAEGRDATISAAEAALAAAKAKSPVVAVAAVTAEALAEEVKVAEAALAAAKAKTPVVAVAAVTAEALAEEVKAAEAALAAAKARKEGDIALTAAQKAEKVKAAKAKKEKAEKALAAANKLVVKAVAKPKAKEDKTAATAA
ncbi:MAG: hypothetical protein QG604_131 [Candidatus Dependentiae bacterium]|nr:hypothetical protein [Candidatus Dependentiae bacterium]